MRIYYSGSVFNIEQTDDAVSSQSEAESNCTEACCLQLLAITKRLANYGKISNPHHFMNEGEGIWALKARCGLRAYGWFAKKKRSIFVISHYIVKKRQKLNPADLKRAIHNRTIYERGGDNE